MLAALFSSCILALQQGQTSRPPPPAEVVARVETSLDEALRSGELRAIESALETAREAPHPAVVHAVVRFLEDERVEVKLAALQALRWLEHPDALDALHRAAKDRKLMRVPELAQAVLRGIGQQAQPSSIAVLANDPFEPFEAGCLRARILGLARIRRVEALEALFGILAPVGTGGQRRIQSRMGDVRLGLMILTGVDRGASPELWESWWRDNKKSFRVPDEMPPLPKELRKDWETFWDLPRVYEREGRREDRGQDPPPRKD
jgi:hypothetical protein